nr:MAG TPA: hypothetical protein [Caudoviricetes sp.]DAM98524.1 MAG TPA: hypothetical protein [Caudoviricetes sp.]
MATFFVSTHLERYCKGSNPLCVTIIIRSLLGTLTAATIRKAV